MFTGDYNIKPEIPLWKPAPLLRPDLGSQPGSGSAY